MNDFQSMKAAVQKYVDYFEHEQVKSKKPVYAEAIQLLQWLSDDHFTFLGYAEYTPNSGKELTWQRHAATCLGVMRDQSTYGVGCFLSEFVGSQHIWPDDPIVVTKSSFVATVHRPGFMDAIIVREFDSAGKIVKEGRFLGLYTSLAYHTHSSQIPYLREKVAYIFDRAKLPSKSHDAKTLEDIVESFSKDELFQISKEALFDTAIGILHIQERPQIRLFIRKDVYGRFYSCMVYLPRDLFNTELRLKFQNILMRELHGKSSNFAPKFLMSILCRIDFLITTDPNDTLVPDLKAIEGKLRAVARNWRDDLRELLTKELGEHHGNFVYNKYARAFSSSYRDDFAAPDALRDIAEIEHLLETHGTLSIDLEQDKIDTNIVHLKLMQCHHGLWLTHVLPILENFGLKVIEERPYEIKLPGDLSIWLSDFLIDAQSLHGQFDNLKDLFKEAFMEVWSQRAENDGFNRLVLTVGCE